MRNTAPLGSLRLASEYLAAATRVLPPPTTDLEAFRLKISFPAYFLVGHSIELSLKAFLLGRGATKDELRSRKFGHKLDALLTEARRRRLGSEVKLSSGTGKSGKSYSVLRRETEQFAEGPYSKALAEAKEMICRSRDRQLLSSLLQVTGATSNSANEEPTSVLNEVASCQPDLLRELAATLTQRDRKGLANRSPQLRAFFK